MQLRADGVHGVHHGGKPHLDRVEPRVRSLRHLARAGTLQLGGSVLRGPLESLEGVLLLPARLQYLLDALHRNLGHIARSFATQRDHVAASRCLPAAGTADRIEPLPLLVAQQDVEPLQRLAHNVDGLDHGLKPRLGGIEAGHRRERNSRRARRLDRIIRLGRGCAEVVERGELIACWPHRVFDPLNRQIAHTGRERVAALSRRRIGLFKLAAIGFCRALVGVRTARISAGIAAAAVIDVGRIQISRVIRRVPVVGP